MAYNFTSNSQGGEPLTKQVSRSLITPQSLTGYREFFRQSSNRESGYLLVKIGREKKWERQWVIFEDGNLRFAVSPLATDEEFRNVLMENVLLLRSNNNAAEPTILIKTTGDDIHLKFADLEEMKKWLFGFQKSVALVLTHILDARNRALLNAKVQTSRMSLDRPEEYGHGNYDNVEKRHGGSIQPPSIGGGSRAFSTDIGSSNGPPRVAQSLAMDSVFDSFQRWNIDRDSSNDASPTIRRVRSPMSAADKEQQAKILAISPAIPIMSTSLPSDEEEYRERVASSYRDQDVGLSPLEIMRNRSHSRGSDDDDDDDEEPDHVTVSTQDESADEGVFEMDGMDEEHHLHTPNRSRTGSDHKANNKRNSPVADSVDSSPRSSFSSRSGDSGKAKKAAKALRWRSGHCTKLGQRERNEDRFVVAPNVQERTYVAEEASLMKAKAAHNLHHPAPGSSYSGLARGLMSQQTSLEHCKHQFGGGNDKSVGYFAVYDGHCGDSASVYLEQKLLDRILSREDFHEDLEAAISECCISIDKEFLAWCKENRKYSGTTALGAFINGVHLTVFNIGDSMAVMSSAGKAIVMSDSHKPDRIDEAERIKRANGWITEEKELYLSRLHQMDYSDPKAIDRAKNMNWVTIHRVCGELAVSRSIGDPDYKGFTPGAKVEAYFGWPQGHEEVFHADLVIPDPECRKHGLTPDDDFLILATDGIWDVMSPEEAVKLVQQALHINHKSPSEAAEELCNFALRLGTSDNVTVVITQFLFS